MRHIVMDHTGDTKTEFDSKSELSVKAAMAQFDELVKEHGYTAAKRTGQGTSEIIKAFDPTAEETIFIPRLQGG